jgi:hypothetical protein
MIGELRKREKKLLWTHKKVNSRKRGRRKKPLKVKNGER